MIEQLLYSCLRQTCKTIQNCWNFRSGMQNDRCTFAMILISFIWLQATDVRLCYQVGEVEEIFTKLNDFEPLNGKRSQLAATSVGTPEEIFSAKDPIESNYDEYPVSIEISTF